MLLVIQVEHGRDQGEQDEHFIQVRHGNVADVGTDQIRLVPAHQHARQAQHHASPAQQRADGRAKFRARHQADPVEQGRQHEQGAHPQDGGLAGQDIFQEEFLVRHVQVARVQLDGEQRQHGRHGDQPAHGFPVPAQPRKGGGRCQQDGLFIDIHECAKANQAEQRGGQQAGTVHPVDQAQAFKESRFLRIYLLVCNFHHFLHSRPPRRAVPQLSPFNSAQLTPIAAALPSSSQILFQSPGSCAACSWPSARRCRPRHP
ncbi:hypothetical protein D3C81_610250 [compost metagenome]